MTTDSSSFSLVRVLRRLAGEQAPEEAGGEVQQMYGHLEAVARASGRESLELALSALMSLTGAPRGFIATLDPDRELRFVVARAFGTLALDNPEALLSKSILNAALSDAGLLVVDDAADDARFADAASVQSLGLRAVVCVPLVHEESPFGVLYLDDPTQAARFDGPRRKACQDFSTLIAPIVARELELEHLRRTARARSEALRSRDGLSGLFANAPEMLELVDKLGRVAPTRVHVLIAGETGTGKTLVAEMLHRASGRQDGPFVTVDCNALDHEQAEADFFGPGGFIESADGGTLILDEVNELPAAVQARLLRVLESGGTDRGGDGDVAHVSVRVVSTTSQRLDALAADLRDDLMLRLRGAELLIPPLRARGEDLLALAQARLEQAARRNQRPATRFSSAARVALGSYTWPGNVRELESVVERAAILCDEETVDIDLLPPELWGPTEEQPNLNLRNSVRAFKRRLVLQARSAADGDHKTTAALLGVNPKYLYQLIKELEIPT